METNKIIAGIELSSSKAIGILAEKISDKSFKILAYKEVDSSHCIKRGVIYNYDDTTNLIKGIIEELENQSNLEVERVYTSIAGLSLKGKHNTVRMLFDEEKIITEDIVERLQNQNIDKDFGDYSVIEVKPQEYKVGIKKQANPVGVSSKNIEGDFLNIVAKEKISSSLEHCFNKSGVELEDMVLTPVSVADIILTDDEKALGCALIDFGADTTTVTVYKSKILRHISVIPLGSNNITKDITSINISYREAERIKKEKIDLRYQEDDYNQELFSEQNNEDLIKLNEIAYSRCEEIIENVWTQMKYTGLENSLIEGIVIIGGGANIRNIDSIISKITGIQKIRFAKETNISVEDSNNNIGKEGRHHTILSIIANGNINCCKPMQEEVKEIQTDLFGTDENIIEQEKLAKERQEEEKKKAKEENRQGGEKNKKEGSSLTKKFSGFIDGLFKDEEN